MIGRRAVLRALGGGALAAAAGAGYAAGVEPGLLLRTRTWRPVLPLWPEGYRLRIVALADIHMGPPWMTPGRLERIVDRANRQGADLIVLLGDYLAGHPFTRGGVAVDRVARILSGLDAPLGVYTILGNHDWWDDELAQAAGHGPTQTHRAFEAAGIPVLENNAVRLSTASGPLWLAGLGDQLAFWVRRRQGLGGPLGVEDMGATLAAITDDAPAILLAHEPDIFPEVPDRFALTLSGHTHGGQVRFFGHSPTVPSRYGNRYAYGPVIEGNRGIVISGGLGCSIAPIRLGVPPEITLVELGAP